MQLRRNFQNRHDEGQTLILVDLDADPPTMHIAHRNADWDSWGPPCREILNQDDEATGDAESQADDNARRLWNQQHGFPEDGSGR